MQKPNRYAFTLVELLIVVTIIALIGIASISGFSRMNEVQDVETTVKTIADTLESYDRQVLRSKITSYDTIFESGSLWFAANLDSYKKSPAIRYGFDFASGTGTVKGDGTGTGVAELHFASYDTSGTNRALSLSGETQPFSFPPNIEKRWYQVSAGIDDRNLNSFQLQYYNLANTQGLPEKEVRLVKIVGGDNVPYDALLVRNILGRKTFQGSGATLVSLESATLTFGKNGKEMLLTISRQ